MTGALRPGQPVLEVTRELVRRLPKTDLHVHLDGSLRPATLLELARDRGVDLPSSDADELAAYMRVTDARDLVDYLERFRITLSVLQDEEAIERVAYELGADAAAENVRYMEARYSPALNTERGLSFEQVVDASLRGFRAAEREFPIRIGLIICGIRNMSPAVTMALADLTVAYKGEGVVALDLAGPENNHPPGDHREAFERVVRANMPATVHAGEAFGPASIHQAIHLCHASRIGHGTRLREDPDLEQYVNDRRITLECCPTSNVQTGVVATLEDHPIRHYYDRGLLVTINTDNRLMSGVSVTEEIFRTQRAAGLSWSEVCDIVETGFRSAFLPYQVRRALLAEVRAEIDALEREALGAPEAGVA
jgi:adenosine deaminase